MNSDGVLMLQVGVDMDFKKTELAGLFDLETLGGIDGAGREIFERE
jgi:hypothetical protein